MQLETAMRAYLANRLTEARQLSQSIVSSYPQTQAGREAKQLLALMGN